MDEDGNVEAFREVNLSDGKCNVSLYVCAEEEKKIDQDPEYASKLFRAALEGKLPSAEDGDSEAGNGDESVTKDAEKDKKKMIGIADWNSEATWNLVNTLKEHFDLLCGSRKELFTIARESLAEAGYTFSLDCIRQKFNSLISSYNRVNGKSLQDGKIKVKWEYYEALYGVMNKVQALQREKKNGDVNSNVKIEPDIDDFSSLLEVDIAEDSDLGSHETSEASTTPEVSKKQEVVEKTNLSKKRPRITSSSPNKKTKLSSENTLKKTPKKNETESDVNGVMKGVEHVVLGNEGVNHTATVLFIDLIKRHKDLLRKKKSAEMFSLIKTQMAKEGFSYTVPNLRKKWYNLLISYRRILERANETGDLVSSWPYYEAIDSIIVDTKSLAEKARNQTHGQAPSPEISPSSRRYRLSDKGARDRLSLDSEEEENVPLSRRSRNSKRASVLDLLRLKEGNIPTSDEEDDFQRNLLEDWEQREIRREERDKVKLDILKKIAKSIETITHNQDEIIDLLKNLK